MERYHVTFLKQSTVQAVQRWPRQTSVLPKALVDEDQRKTARHLFKESEMSSGSIDDILAEQDLGMRRVASSPRKRQKNGSRFVSSFKQELRILLLFESHYRVSKK